MKTDYRTIPAEKVINFAKNASLQRLLVAQINIEEYIEKCDYSTEELTTEILEATYNRNTQIRLLETKFTILEKRGAAYEFLTIIKKEMKTRAQAYEERERATR